MYPIDKLGNRCLVAFRHCFHTMHPFFGILKVETYPPDFLGHVGGDPVTIQHLAFQTLQILNRFVPLGPV